MSPGLYLHVVHESSLLSTLMETFKKMERVVPHMMQRSVVLPRAGGRDSEILGSSRRKHLLQGPPLPE